MGAVAVTLPPYTLDEALELPRACYLADELRRWTTRLAEGDGDQAHLEGCVRVARRRLREFLHSATTAPRLPPIDHVPPTEQPLGLPWRGHRYRRWRY